MKRLLALLALVSVPAYASPYTSGPYFDAPPSGGGGVIPPTGVFGPAATSVNAFAVWNNTTGSLLRNSIGTIDIGGNIGGISNIALTTISSRPGTSVSVNLGVDAGDDFIVGPGNHFVVQGDTGSVAMGRPISASGARLHIDGPGVSTVPILPTDYSLLLSDNAVGGDAARIGLISSVSGTSEISFGDDTSVNSGSIQYVNSFDQLRFNALGNEFFRGTDVGVTVSDTGTSPLIGSSVLTATSTTRGFLQPRMTTAERNAIAAPAAGLSVYDTDTNTPFFYNGTAWTQDGGTGDVTGPASSVAFSIPYYIGTTGKVIGQQPETFIRVSDGAIGIGTALPQALLHVESSGTVAAPPSETQLVIVNNLAGITSANIDLQSGATGRSTITATDPTGVQRGRFGVDMGPSQIVMESSSTEFFRGDDDGVLLSVGGAGVAQPSAALAVDSTVSGLLQPRMTSAERTLIPTPAAGLSVYDTDTNTPWYYNGTTWVDETDAGGDVVGPASSVADSIPKFADATGKLLADATNVYLNSDRLGIGAPTPMAPLMIKPDALQANPPTVGADKYMVFSDIDGGVHRVIFMSNGTGVQGFNWGISGGTLVQGVLDYDFTNDQLQFGADGQQNTMQLANNQLRLQFAGPTGGALNPDAALEIQSTTRAFLPPVMTDLQRNAISATPTAGLMIYNSDTADIEYCDNVGTTACWQKVLHVSEATTSTDKAIPTWDGTPGESLRNTDLLYDEGPAGVNAAGVLSGAAGLEIKFRTWTATSPAEVVLGGLAGDDFTVDTDVLVVESDNDRVGVGTATPFTKMQVVAGGTALGSKGGTVFSVQDTTTAASPANIAMHSGNTATTAIFWGDTDSNSIARIEYSHSADAMSFGVNGITSVFLIESDGDAHFGVASPEASAALEVSSTTRGFLPPRMTNLQRDAIPSPVAGLIVYSTDDNCLQQYTTSWGCIDPAGGGSSAGKAAYGSMYQKDIAPLTNGLTTTPSASVFDWTAGPVDGNGCVTVTGLPVAGQLTVGTGCGGTYRITGLVQARVTSMAAGTAYVLDVFQNGSVVTQASTAFTEALNQGASMHVDAFVSLSAGDTVDLRYSVSTGTENVEISTSRLAIQRVEE